MQSKVKSEGIYAWLSKISSNTKQAKQVSIADQNLQIKHIENVDEGHCIICDN